LTPHAALKLFMKRLAQGSSVTLIIAVVWLMAFPETQIVQDWHRLCMSDMRVLSDMELGERVYANAVKRGRDYPKEKLGDVSVSMFEDGSWFDPFGYWPIGVEIGRRYWYHVDACGNIGHVFVAD